MTIGIFETRRFRCIYRYSHDAKTLNYFWKKGKETVTEEYALEDLSNFLGYWRGRPQSTRDNMILAAVFAGTGLLLILLASYLWMLQLGFVMTVKATAVVFNEIGFLTPIEYTVLSYRDGSDCLYIPRNDHTERQRLEFEKGLVNAIDRSSRYASQ